MLSILMFIFAIFQGFIENVHHDNYSQTMPKTLQGVLHFPKQKRHRPKFVLKISVLDLIIFITK